MKTANEYLSAVTGEITCALRALNAGKIELAAECCQLAKSMLDMLSASGLPVVEGAAEDVLDAYTTVSGLVIKAQREIV